MLIFREFFKTQSKYTPKRTKLRHIFINFLGELAYACNYVFLHENSHFLFKIILKIYTKTYQSSKHSKNFFTRITPQQACI